MKITITGKDYNFEYNNLSLFKVERELGIGIIELVSNPKNLEKMHVATTLVWCGITDKITLEEFALSISLKDLTPALEIVGKLITDAFDTGEEVKKK
tara:strand:+ start:733 stop:1023 length:291 start_codon:yes stop_codon:yes gene_type:complete